MPISDVERLVTYHLEIGTKGGRPVVEREILGSSLQFPRSRPLWRIPFYLSDIDADE